MKLRKQLRCRWILWRFRRASRRFIKANIAAAGAINQFTAAWTASSKETHG